MVVNDEGTGSRVACGGKDSTAVAASDDAGVGDDAIVTDIRDETDFVVARARDFSAGSRRCTRRETQLQRHVLSVFFFAAGKRTLLRISRYPGECGCMLRSVGGSSIWCSGSSGS